MRYVACFGLQKLGRITEKCGHARFSVFPFDGYSQRDARREKIGFGASELASRVAGLRGQEAKW